MTRNAKGAQVSDESHGKKCHICLICTAGHRDVPRDQRLQHATVHTCHLKGTSFDVKLHSGTSLILSLTVASRGAGATCISVELYNVAVQNQTYLCQRMKRKIEYCMTSTCIYLQNDDELKTKTTIAITLVAIAAYDVIYYGNGTKNSNRKSD